MSFDAWRSAVGGQWQRLMLYPSGLTAIVLVLLAWLIGRWLARSQALPSSKWLDVIGCAGPLMVIALLPLPKTVELRSPLDLPTAWLLLDIPLILAIVHEWSASSDYQLRAVKRLSGYFVGLPLFGLVLLLHATLTRTITLTTLPKFVATPVWGWLGLGLWTIALGPSLQFGSWRTSDSQALALGLRRLGHSLLITIALAAFSKRITWVKDERLQWLILLGGVWLIILLFDQITRRVSIQRITQVLWLIAGIALIGFVLTQTVL